jgi:hypothetical protein
VCEVEGDGNFMYSDGSVRYRVREMLCTVMCVRCRLREILCKML